FNGGWKNTKFVIRKNRAEPEVCEVEAPDILNAGEFRGLWIKWLDDIITVCIEGVVFYVTRTLIHFQSIGVCTGWGATGSKEPLFVGHVSHERTQTVGEVQPSYGTCYVSYGG
ncbi:uncharacterized protein LOC129780620, partial [Toxorhynchites rutilus septentrionalis]|uniref:uncharacterized protein LOC129780620 n=1 Tax=Toxorhynchites rutilus septentrionalis TaxID=329112 RepID=UPI00247881ED